MFPADEFHVVFNVFLFLNCRQCAGYLGFSFFPFSYQDKLVDVCEKMQLQALRIERFIEQTLAAKEQKLQVIHTHPGSPHTHDDLSIQMLWSLFSKCIVLTFAGSCFRCEFLGLCIVIEISTSCYLFLLISQFINFFSFTISIIYIYKSTL